MGTIRVHTANERIVFDNKPIITSGNKNINDISVTFCDKWLSLGENTEYWAVFFKDEKVIYKRKLENGYCLIPNAVMSKKGFFYFGFYAEAENGEKVKTSKVAEYEVTQGVPTEETADGDESTDSGNIGGGSSGNINIDLSNYVTKDEMPEIDVDEVVSRLSSSVNIYPALPVDKWIDNCFAESNVLQADENYCSSGRIYVNAGRRYIMTHEPYSLTDDKDANLSINEEINLETGRSEYSFITNDKTSCVFISIDKREFGGTTDINTAIENFNSVFMIVEGSTLPSEFVPYEEGGYKLNDDVKIPVVGDISTLKTKNKNNIVEAINELVGSELADTESVPGGGGTIPIEPEIPESSTDDFSKFIEKIGDGINLYEPQTEGWVDDGFILSSGEVKVNTTSYKSYAVTPPIPVNGETTYTVTPIPNDITSLADKSKVRAYDGSGTALAEMVLTVNENSVTFTTPENAESIRFTVRVKLFGGREVVDAGDIETVINTFNSTFMLVEGTEVPEEYESFGNSGYKLKNIALPDKSVNIENVSDKTLPIFARLAGKKIANFGDSIFGNARPPKDVSTFLAENTGAEVLNCAFGGCRMGSHTGHWDCFSMYRLADAIASNDYSLQEDALNYDDRVSYAEEPLALIKSTDFSTVDILTIAYGTNDFTGGNKIDNAENLYDTTTLGGALRYSIEKLLTAFPNLRIFILSATYRFWKNENDEYTEDSNTYLNKHGKTLVDYNAKLAEIANEYNLPFVDNYNIGIGKFNRYQYFPATDGTHHNENGRRLIAERLAGALNNGGTRACNEILIAEKAAALIDTALTSVIGSGVLE